MPHTSGTVRLSSNDTIVVNPPFIAPSLSLRIGFIAHLYTNVHVQKSCCTTQDVEVDGIGISKIFYDNFFYVMDKALTRLAILYKDRS